MCVCLVGKRETKCDYGGNEEQAVRKENADRTSVRTTDRKSERETIMGIKTNKREEGKIIENGA